MLDSLLNARRRRARRANATAPKVKITRDEHGYFIHYVDPKDRYRPLSPDELKDLQRKADLAYQRSLG